MKHLLLRFVFASALLVPAVVSAASFEGKVTFKMSPAKGQPHDITYNIKGDKMRIEMPGQNKMGGMIMDTTKREMLIIMDEQKMYMTMALPEASANSADKKGNAPERKKSDMTLERTSETQKILGYTATKYIAKSQDSQTETEMWLAEGLGTFMGYNNPMAGGRRGGPAAGNAPQGWEQVLAGKDLFPLRVVGKEKGQETFRMETTAIEKQSLPDTLFVPPPSYQKLDMGGMMGGMMKGMMQGMGK